VADAIAQRAIHVLLPASATLRSRNARSAASLSRYVCLVRRSSLAEAKGMGTASMTKVWIDRLPWAAGFRPGEHLQRPFVEFLVTPEAIDATRDERLAASRFEQHLKETVHPF
jgi:hypothetical protein